VKQRNRDVYTPFGVSLLTVSHEDRVSRGLMVSYKGSGLEAYFRSTVMITDREVSW